MRNLLFLLISSVFIFSCEMKAKQKEIFEFQEQPITNVIADSVFTINIAPDSTYSRSIIYKDSLLYCANSDGKIYVYDFQQNNEIQSYSDIDFEELRDLELLGNGNLLAMMSGSKGKLLHVGIGDSVSTKSNTAMMNVFLDGMDINENGVGAMMGDPVDSCFSLFVTDDYGSNWYPIQPKIKALKGEAGYAASGTTIQMIGKRNFYFVSGGDTNRLFKIDFSDFNNVKTETFGVPIITGEGKGAFSMHFKNALEGIVLGGDYLNPALDSAICVLTKDGGKTWQKPEKSVNGYRSCVVYDSTRAIAFSSGRNGVDYSLDFGNNWKKLSDIPLFSLCLNEEYLFGTARDGEIKQIKLKYVK